jgi:hypothetical protein
MTRDPLLQAFAKERRDRALGRKRMAHPIRRPRLVIRDEPDSPWNDVLAVYAGIVALLVVFVLAYWLPR